MSNENVARWLWFAEGVARYAGYMCLCLAGIAFANREYVSAVIYVLVGHLLVCAAEVLGERLDKLL